MKSENRSILFVASVFFALSAFVAGCDDSSSASGDEGETSALSSAEGQEDVSSGETSQNTVSSSETSLSSWDCPYADEPLIDKRDDHTYRTVKIGDQVWMAENLNYAVEGSWTNDSLDKDGSIYGRYYSLEQSKTACPEGWHTPSYNEAWELVLYVGNGSEDSAGWKLKTRSGWNWDDYDNVDGNGVDEFCFGAKSAGYLIDPGRVSHVGEDAHFWTSNSYMGKKWDASLGKEVETGMEAYFLAMWHSDERGKVKHYGASYGGNIRCVKGEKLPASSSSGENINVPAVLPDSVQQEIEKAQRIERLNQQISKLQSAKECETIDGITEEEISYCKTRFCILFPEKHAGCVD